MRCTFQIYINPKMLSILICFCATSVDCRSFSRVSQNRRTKCRGAFRVPIRTEFQTEFQFRHCREPRERESLSLMGWDWMGCVIIIYKCWINPHVYRRTNIQSDICFVYVYFTHSHTLVRRPCAWHYNVLYIQIY